MQSPTLFDDDVLRQRTMRALSMMRRAVGREERALRARYARSAGE